MSLNAEQLSSRDISSIPLKADVEPLSGVISDLRLLGCALAEGSPEAAVLRQLILQLLLTEGEPLRPLLISRLWWNAKNCRHESQRKGLLLAIKSEHTLLWSRKATQARAQVWGRMYVPGEHHSCLLLCSLAF